jgi:haloalkane dehalogenase
VEAFGYAPCEMVQGVPEAVGMAYRESGHRSGPAVLFVHGYPESSYMWRHALAAVAGAGWRGVAPDLPGYGDSPPGDRPGTWEEHVVSLERFRSALSLDDVVLVTHDWGVPIGLRWACDQAGVARALVISDGGFFADRRWHDMANLMRTPGEGERLMDSMNRGAFAAFLGQASPAFDDEAVDEYWKGGATRELRQRHLELYRSGDFSKLEPYEGCLARLGVPALVVWGAQDRFASVRMAARFGDELPGSELRVFDDAGHFVWEEEPDGTCSALVDFLERRVPRS